MRQSLLPYHTFLYGPLPMQHQGGLPWAATASAVSPQAITGSCLAPGACVMHLTRTTTPAAYMYMLPACLQLYVSMESSSRPGVVQLAVTGQAHALAGMHVLCGIPAAVVGLMHRWGWWTAACSQMHAIRMYKACNCVKRPQLACLKKLWLFAVLCSNRHTLSPTSAA